MDNDNSQGSREGEELKKLEEELKSLGDNPQKAPTQTPIVPTVLQSPPPSQPVPVAPTTEAPIPVSTPTEGPKSSKMMITAIGFLVLSLIGAGAYLLVNRNTGQKACTEEAKLCSDGSAVGRVGPNCEFSPCPTATSDPIASWEETTGETFLIKTPPTWKENSRLATYQNDLCFSTERETSQEAGGEFTPGLADLCISMEPSLLNFSGLESSSSKIISLAGEAAEQRMGYGGVAGSVYMVKTILKSTNGNNYVFTLTTQDESFKEIFQEEYDQILSTFKFLEVSPEASPAPSTTPTIKPSANPQL